MQAGLPGTIAVLAAVLAAILAAVLTAVLVAGLPSTVAALAVLASAGLSAGVQAGLPSTVAVLAAVQLTARWPTGRLAPSVAGLLTLHGCSCDASCPLLVLLTGHMGHFSNTSFVVNLLLLLRQPLLLRCNHGGLRLFLGCSGFLGLCHHGGLLECCPQLLVRSGIPANHRHSQVAALLSDLDLDLESLSQLFQLLDDVLSCCHIIL